MPDHRTGIGEEPVGMLDARDRIAHGFCLLPVVMVRQAIDLRDVENGVGLEERNLAIEFLTSSVGLRPGEAAGEDNHRAGLALANRAAELEGLLERHPDRDGVATRDGLGPQQQHVHAAVGQAVMA
jgi:hypothetical protein